MNPLSAALPFEPETLERISLRFKEVIPIIFELPGNGFAANFSRRHVFDFTEGARMIVKRERFTGSANDILHFAFGSQKSATLDWNTTRLSLFGLDMANRLTGNKLELVDCNIKLDAVHFWFLYNE